MNNIITYSNKGVHICNSKQGYSKKIAAKAMAESHQIPSKLK